MRRDGPSDKTILRRARQGDRQSFLTLLHRYDPRLRRLALRLLADPNRLERVLNRAYLKAWRSLPFLKRSEPAAGWLYRTVYNACINELRWEPARPAPPAPEGGDPVPLPAASIERRLQALRALRPSERIPLVLVDGEGLSLDAAARMMRLESAEVARDLTRARGRWRAFVSGEPEPLPEPTTPAKPVDGRHSGDGHPPLAPSPAATLAKLAALAAPTAPREPGGHVKLLASTPGESGPPPVAAKPPTTRRRDIESTPGTDQAPPAPEAPARPAAKAPRPARSNRTRRAQAADASDDRGEPQPADAANPSDPRPRRPTTETTRTTKRATPAKAAERTNSGLQVPGATVAKRTPRAKPPAAAGPPTAGPTAHPDVQPSGRQTPQAAEGRVADAQVPDDGPEANGLEHDAPAPAGGGAGARRKRRRDAKRAVRSRPRGGTVAGTSNPANPDDRDPG